MDVHLSLRKKFYPHIRSLDGACVIEEFAPSSDIVRGSLNNLQREFVVSVLYAGLSETSQLAERLALDSVNCIEATGLKRINQYYAHTRSLDGASFCVIEEFAPSSEIVRGSLNNLQREFVVFVLYSGLPS